MRERNCRLLYSSIVWSFLLDADEPNPKLRRIQFISTFLFDMVIPWDLLKVIRPVHLKKSSISDHCLIYHFTCITSYPYSPIEWSFVISSTPYLLIFYEGLPWWYHGALSKYLSTYYMKQKDTKENPKYSHYTLKHYHILQISIILTCIFNLKPTLGNTFVFIHAVWTFPPPNHENDLPSTIINLIWLYFFN